MAMKCASCGKGVLHGHNVSHSKRRTVKVFKPNLHATRVVVDGTTKRIRLCTKCLRMYKKVAAFDKEVTTLEVTPQAQA
ncbi:MAG: large subunit ribosomal protein [Patescibacteria group bacterium]|jgi:large subunit ribosomal protein L28|nr:large subunit ribosomal protein [Patescibacteria group bacterium]MDQ5954750.1 large subunit ribosomal protein [Patescibacteria group bacterium]